jgi:hypothetical protein
MGVGGRSNCQRDKRTRHPVWILVLVLTLPLPHTSLVHVHHSQSSNPTHTHTRTHAILAPVVHLLASSPPHLICSLILHSTSLSIHLPFFTHPPTCNPRQAPCPQSWQSTQRGCATTAAPISPHRIASHHITSPLLRPVQSRLHPIDFAPGTVPARVIRSQL